MAAVMAPEPQRREEGVRHLNAHIVPLERALIARAKALELQTASSPVTHDMTPGEAVILLRVAGEFRALAEELHHW